MTLSPTTWYLRISVSAGRLLNKLAIVPAGSALKEWTWSVGAKQFQVNGPGPSRGNNSKATTISVTIAWQLDITTTIV